MAEIRAAVPADAEATARCHLACWQETYGPLVDADRLAVLTADVAGRTARWQEVIAAGVSTIRLAEERGVIVGLASSGPHPDPESDVAEQLFVLYVRQSHWDTGLGHRLLGAVLADRDAALWVLASNARARRFYARHGFVGDGVELEEPHFGGVELRMVRRR